MRFKKGKIYEISAIDHYGKLGDPGDKPAILEFVGWFRGRKIENGVRMVLLQHSRARDEEDVDVASWSAIIEKAIIETKELK